MNDVDEDLLDALEADLLAAVGRSEAITSGELAARHCPDDGEAQPETRQAVKQLMRERGLPIIGCNAGYYVPTSNEPVADAVQDLQNRIEGIKERQRLLVENWAGYRDDDDEDSSDAVDSERSTLSEEEVEAIKEDDVLTLSDFDAEPKAATDGGVDMEDKQ